jgi:hypothetical protein
MSARTNNRLIPDNYSAAAADSSRMRRPRDADLRVDAQMGFEVTVIRYRDWDKIGILITQRPGIRMEAVLTPHQAEQLAGHLLGLVPHIAPRRSRV